MKKGGTRRSHTQMFLSNIENSILFEILGMQFKSLAITNGFPTAGCYDEQVALGNYSYHYVDGKYRRGGRVEVCYNEILYPVCVDDWSDDDATVVCRRRGYRFPYYRMCCRKNTY